MGVDSELRTSESSPPPRPFASDLEDRGLKLRWAQSQDEDTWGSLKGRPNPPASDAARNKPLPLCCKSPGSVGVFVTVAPACHILTDAVRSDLEPSNPSWSL